MEDLTNSPEIEKEPETTEKPNAWKAGRPPGRKSKVNRSDNEGGKNLIKADNKHDIAERDDPAYKTFSKIVGGKEGLKELAAWSTNEKAVKLFQILDDEHYKTYGIKAIAKRCGMTLPELCNLFREKYFLTTFLTFFTGVSEIAKGAVEDASPGTDACPICVARKGGVSQDCLKCKGTGQIRTKGDKEARRDVFKAVGLIKESPIVQQISNVTIEGLDNFEDLMKSAAKTSKKVEKNEEIPEAEIVE